MGCNLILTQLNKNDRKVLQNVPNRCKTTPKCSERPTTSTETQAHHQETNVHREAVKQEAQKQATEDELSVCRCVAFTCPCSAGSLPLRAALVPCDNEALVATITDSFTSGTIVALCFSSSASGLFSVVPDRNEKLECEDV